MKIHEVSKNTNLSKKSIYFYMEEGLINPQKNESNGYHEFDQNDVETLQFISMLRKIGMPIQTIKEVFQFPRMTNFFMHRQMYQLKEQIRNTLKQLNDVEDIIDTMLPNSTINDLEKLTTTYLNTSTLIDDSFIENKFPSQDARIIAIIIWGSFLEINAGEYHQFLWHKMAQLLSKQYQGNLEYLKELIYSLPATSINDIHVHTYKISQDLVQESKEIIDEYTERIVQSVLTLSNDKELQEYWKLSYNKLLVPIFSFSNAFANSLMSEYNPRYNTYLKVMQICCENAYKRLTDEYSDELATLEIVLNNHINLTQYNYIELVYILTFENSIYTKVSLTRLNEILNLK